MLFPMPSTDCNSLLLAEIAASTLPKLSRSRPALSGPTPGNPCNFLSTWSIPDKRKLTRLENSRFKIDFYRRWRSKFDSGVDRKGVAFAGDVRQRSGLFFL
jgi:hypothetical protein